MENKKNNKLYIFLIFIIVLVVLIFLILLLFNKFNHNENMNVGTYEYEMKQLVAFKSKVNEKTQECNNFGYSKEQCAYSVSDWMDKNYSSYNSNSVNVAVLELDTVFDGAFDSMSELVNSVNSVFDNFDIENTLTDSKILSHVIAMKSNTVCQVVLDSKYCVNKLSANVYIHDENSSKWVVLIHPFMTNGSVIYNSIGEMYKEHGYNVLAPDLRGFGNSDGSVAMGYLESLDVYDWIKDLNSNWKDKSRYGTSVAPDTIIVHGISLGGATTLQLATNPDIAGAVGKEPYTKTLTQLNVKGFIDDCGYTSMSGIITDMFSMSGNNSNQLSSLLGNLGIEEVDFMSKIQTAFNQLGIEGFDFDLNSDLSSVTDVYNVFSQFTKQSGFLDDAINGSVNFGGVNTTVPNVDSNYKDNPFLNGTYDLGSMDFGVLKDKYGSSYEIPSKEDVDAGINKYKDYLDKYTSENNNKIPFLPTNSSSDVMISPVNNNLSNLDVNFLDGVIGTVLMDLVGVGLTEDNYVKYSDVFSDGRHFPTNAKVGIIHGTSDTTVPFSNANVVASNISPAILVKKWEVSGAPHAFVIVGSKTNEYNDYIAKFTDCVENTSCRNIG